MIFEIILIIYFGLIFFVYRNFYISKWLYINNIFYKNKIITPQFKKTIEIALSYYPSLKKTKIQFLVMKWKWFHSSALPNPLTIFLPKKWRSYIIIISDETKKELEHWLLKNLPEKLQIWILWHELAHIVDYENKSFFQVIQILWRYLIPSKRKKFENSIDILAIKHGIGYYLHGFYTYLIKKNPHHTKNFMENYLSDEDIKKLTKELTWKEIN